MVDPALTSQDLDELRATMRSTLGDEYQVAMENALERRQAGEFKVISLRARAAQCETAANNMMRVSAKL